MTATPRFHVGQLVLLLQDRREPEEVTITRVGRTNAAIQQYGWERVFNMETGVDPRNKVGTADRIITFEQYADQTRRLTALTELRNLGVTSTLGGGLDTYSTDALTSVVNILTEDRADQKR